MLGSVVSSVRMAFWQLSVEDGLDALVLSLKTLRIEQKHSLEKVIFVRILAILPIVYLLLPHRPGIVLTES